MTARTSANPDIVNTQLREDVIELATDAINHGLAIAERTYSEAQPASMESYTPLVLGVLVRVIFDRMVLSLGETPEMTRSTLLLLVNDLVLEAAEEVREKIQH